VQEKRQPIQTNPMIETIWRYGKGELTETTAVSKQDFSRTELWPRSLPASFSCTDHFVETSPNCGHIRRVDITSGRRYGPEAARNLGNFVCLRRKPRDSLKGRRYDCRHLKMVQRPKRARDPRGYPKETEGSKRGIYAGQPRRAEVNPGIIDDA
jgi:hypothetical protein